MYCVQMDWSLWNIHVSAESTSTLWSLEEESDERTEGIVEQDFSFA